MLPMSLGPENTSIRENLKHDKALFVQVCFNFFNLLDVIIL